jgi:hypothetical protein
MRHKSLRWSVLAIALLPFGLALNAWAAECHDSQVKPQPFSTTSVPVPGDRWMEIDLYWFDQSDIPGSVSCFWDRFAPLYQNVRGDRGLILNVGWTVGYIMEWSGDPQQRITLPTGAGQQPWVQESGPLAGTTEQRKAEWKQRFASPTIVTRSGYGPWTYGDLHRLTDALRSEAGKRGIASFKVGSLAYAWNDAYGEIAPWAKRHPEVFTPWEFTRKGQKQSGKFFDPAATLHQDSARLGGLPSGITEGVPVHQAFAAQWGSVSKAAGLDAIMLRDSFGMPIPYQRAGPDGLLEPSPQTIARHTDATSALIRETKTANPSAIVMMYSNAASAYGDWRCNGLDLERIAREGFLDVWVDQTWAGAWNEVGVRHNSFWNNPVLGWTYQLTYTLMHSAILAGTHVKHYPLIETFDAWESWDVLHTVPERLRWGIWAYSHAAVKTPTGIKVPDGSYISWANQGKRLLSNKDVAFLNENISQAVIDAHHITEVFGPTLVYSRTAAQWEADHATPDRDAKQWLDEQIGSVVKWPIPVLSSTRIEWLPQVHADAFVLGGISHLTAQESVSIHELAKRGTPLLLVGSPTDGFDPALRDLLSLDSKQTRPSSSDSPTLNSTRASGIHVLTWDPPDLAVEDGKRLLDIWGGSDAPYASAAEALNTQLSQTASPHAPTIDAAQAMSFSAWKTGDATIHLMFANLEEGLRDDADATRTTTIVLPPSWQKLRWNSLWPTGSLDVHNGTIHVSLDQARSEQLTSSKP